MNKLFIYLKTIIFDLSIRKRLLLFLVVGLVGLPLIAEGLIPDPFALISAQLEGISEAVGPLKGFVIYLFLLLILGLISISVSTWAIRHAANPENLEIMGSEAVQIGWQFTSSLANIGIIIALIVIGIATILDKQKYGAKKALPRLIIVALLINFSLVFVGAIVDVAQIIMNTFYRAELFTELTAHLRPALDSVLTTIVTYIGGLVAQFMIPLQSSLAQVAFATSFLGLGGFAIFPSLIEVFATSLVSLKVSMILFLYALFFLIRIFILQILAIFSPLAFLAWAVPEGKEYWSKWLNMLIEWSFLGIILFFFLTLALTITAPLQPDTGVTVWDDLGSVPTVVLYYIILGVYMGLALYMGKKMAPKGAQAIVGSAKKAATGFAMSNVGKALGRRWEDVGVQGAKGAADAFKKDRDDIQEQRKRMEQSSGLSKLGNYAKLKTSQATDSAARTTENLAKRREQKRVKQVERMMSNMHNQSLINKTKGNAPKYQQEAAADELLNRHDEEGWKSVVENNRLSADRRAKAIDKLAQEGVDLSGLEFNASEISDALEKEISDETINARPDIAVDLGLEDNMESVFSKLSGNDVHDIKLGEMDMKDRKEAVKQIVSDSGMLENVSTANQKFKTNFVETASAMNTEVPEGSDREASDSEANRFLDKWEKTKDQMDSKKVQKLKPIRKQIQESLGENEGGGSSNEDGRIITEGDDDYGMPDDASRPERR